MTSASTPSRSKSTIRAFGSKAPGGHSSKSGSLSCCSFTSLGERPALNKPTIFFGSIPSMMK